jgi:hypothetical protein
MHGKKHGMLVGTGKMFAFRTAKCALVGASYGVLRADSVHVPDNILCFASRQFAALHFLRRIVRLVKHLIAVMRDRSQY